MKQSVERYASDLAKEFAGKSMVVFLCGPTYREPVTPGAQLRRRLETALAAAGFEVVLGEDDGLIKLQQQHSKYAHDNELDFIQDQAAAIVLVAASVGSFCELGLFSHTMPKNTGPSRDLILLVEEKFRSDNSYFNAGPAKAVEDFGKVFFADFATFDVSEVVNRLSRRRTMWVKENRGRPRRRSSP